MPFLDSTIRRNPGLIKAAVALHQAGQIPPNTLLLDLDTFVANASALLDEAERLSLSTYFMTKQYGRNPVITRAITDGGRASTVAVDMQCAQAITSNGIPLGHVGNLCQVPEGDLSTVIGRMHPEVMSIFSRDKARSASAAAIRAGAVQDILLRVHSEGDVVFPGMAGGFELKELPDVVIEMRTLPGIRIVGVTTFPAVSYNEREPRLTPNVTTLIRAADLLSRLGINVKQINAPGNTAVNVLELLASAGATHVEPGSALSGHTPFHLFDDALPERPASVYVTEVSHFVDDEAWIFGGGFFLDDPPVPELVDFADRRDALVGSDPSRVLDRKVGFRGIGAKGSRAFGQIDYHGILSAAEGVVHVGDSVVFGFRTQAFVTRSYVGVVEGCLTDAPSLRGLFDAQGHLLDPVTHS